MRSYLGKEERVEQSNASGVKRKEICRGSEMKRNYVEQKEGLCLWSKGAQNEWTLEK